MPICVRFSFSTAATPEDWAKSVEGFEQALALDPEFGRAAAQLAWMYCERRMGAIEIESAGHFGRRGAAPSG